MPLDVQREQVRFLYGHLPTAIVAELVVAMLAALVLWHISKPKIILCWLLFLVCTSFLGRVVLAYSYKKHQTSLSTDTWIILYAIGVIFSGIFWGFMGGFLMPQSGLINQTFVVFVLLGIITGANNFYSANRTVYALFLITAFSPFCIWVLLNGSFHFLMGASALIYFIAMLIISANNYSLIKDSIMLRFKNSDLDLLNHELELEVKQRTIDLRNSIALIESTLQSIDYGLIVLNLDLHVNYYNQQFLHLWGLETLPLHQALNINLIHSLTNKLANPELYKQGIYESRATPELEFHDELKLADGRIFERFAKPYVVDTKVVGHVWGYRDITKKKELESSIVFQANHDALTKLPNRVLLHDRIEHDLEIANRFQSQLAVMFVDLDHFKDINDVLGHQKGDILLQIVAKRLEECIRKSDTVARFGGDEFIILFLTKGHKEVTELCKKILKIIAIPIKIDKEELHISASIGMCIYPQDGLDGTSLIKNADMAMYQAKKSGRNQYQIYNDAVSLKAKRHYDIHQQLLNKPSWDEFRVFYQPIFNVTTKQIVAVEALLRWDNPVLGSVAPSEFISIAEEIGIIIPLSEWLIRTVCLQNKKWQKEQGAFICVAVNISSLQIKRGNLNNFLATVLAETNLDSQYLTIELTETSLMDNSINILSKLHEIRKLGVEIAIDDFGTGYSSFRYLTEFPATHLKIDQSLIGNCETNTKNSSVIKAIVTMCHQLNLRVIAEGVQTEKQLNIVTESGCDEMQGFLFCEPLNAEACLELLLKYA
ncbi:MAG: EAL domain-containing protein [Legionella sp.]